jgi:hypothetical protein
MATSSVAFIKAHSVSSHEAAHNFAEWGGAYLKQEMKMVGD